MVTLWNKNKNKRPNKHKCILDISALWINKSIVSKFSARFVLTLNLQILPEDKDTL